MKLIEALGQQVNVEFWAIAMKLTKTQDGELDGIRTGSEWTRQIRAQVMSNTEFLGFYFTWQLLLGPAADSEFC